MRKLVYVVALVAALVVPAASLAAPKPIAPPVICGTACDGGGGGYGYATAKGVATYVGALYGVPWAGTSTADVTVSWG